MYLNQSPSFDNHAKADVFWVGLSAVQFNDCDAKTPLSAQTRSGGLIHIAEQRIGLAYTFYKTNIVKCLPLNGGKIRYPLEHEMSKCYPNLVDEMSKLVPSVTFLLGRQVSSFVLKQFGITKFQLAEDFKFETYFLGGTYYVPVQHPSYVLVYRRKYIDMYIAGLTDLIENLVDKRCSA